MGFKDFTVGEVLTSSDVDNYLMKQAVIGCTSGTRPSSPQEGMTIYETDTDAIRVYDGASWRYSGAYAGEGISFTPAFVAGTTDPTMGNSTTIGRYWRVGPSRIDIYVRVQVGSTFTDGSGAYALTLPVNCHATHSTSALHMFFYDTSGAANYQGVAVPGIGVSGTDVGSARFLLDQNSGGGFSTAQTHAAPVAPDTGDFWVVEGTYWGVAG